MKTKDTHLVVEGQRGAFRDFPLLTTITPPDELKDHITRAAMKKAVEFYQEFFEITVMVIESLAFNGEESLFQHAAGFALADEAPRTMEEKIRLTFERSSCLQHRAYTMVGQAIVAQSIFEQLFRDHNKSGRIVSFGSGPMILEMWLALVLRDCRQPLSIKSVDVAEIACELQRRVVRKLVELAGGFALLQDIEILRASMENSGLPTASADVVIAVNSLMWVPQWRQAISEMARIVCVGGLVLLYITEGTAFYQSGQRPSVSVSDIWLSDVLDELERNNLEIQFIRATTGGKGTGYNQGTRLGHYFIAAKRVVELLSTSRWLDRVGFEELLMASLDLSTEVLRPVTEQDE